jgi:hypothetical protein
MILILFNSFCLLLLIALIMIIITKFWRH